MNYLNGLNDKQLEAVKSIDSNLRIIAGAGSGKTKVVTSRIVYLIEQGIEPSSILAITFTNKAAQEMKERVYPLLDVSQRRVHISTIHSLCVSILRSDIVHLGYPRNFGIIDSEDQKTVLKEGVKQLEIDSKTINYNSILAYISNNKSAKVSPSFAIDKAITDIELNIARLYDYYSKRLKDMMSLDFDDLLLFTERLFMSNSHVLSKWQNKYNFIHVDEFQDVDDIQYNIIKMLCNKEDTILCVVGDPDQTIYTWRGAKVNIILNLDYDFKDLKTIILNQNYRSTKSILGAANSIIVNNKLRVEKELFTINNDNLKVKHYSSEAEDFECEWISKEINVLTKSGVDYKDIGILYRSNFLSRNIEKELISSKIPYRIFGGVRFYERKEVKDALAYLTLIANTSKTSDLALKRVINEPKRGIGLTTLSKIENLAIEYNMSYFEVIKNHTITTGKIQNEINNFVALIEKHQQLLNEISIERVLTSILDEAKYISNLEEMNETDRLENIKSLTEDILDFEMNDQEATLDMFLQDVMILTEKQSEVENQGVTLMTIHASKGLEFDNVFVYELCEGVFPSPRSIQDSKDSLEEERRLAYVAFTRAKKRLYLSDSSGYSMILDTYKTPSRFIKEIDEQYIEHCGIKQFTNNRTFKPYTNTTSSNTTSSSISSSAMKSYVDNNKSNINTNKNAPIRKGDLIEHSVFGKGVVLSASSNIIEVSFDSKFGRKKLGANHPAIKRL